MMNVGFLHKVAQANALAASIEQGHVFDFKPQRATVARAVVGRRLTMNVEQLVAVIAHSGAAAVVTVERPAIQDVVVMEDLEDAVVDPRPAHNCGRWPANGNRRGRRAVVTGNHILVIVAGAQIDRITRLSLIQGYLNRGQGVLPGIAAACASAGGRDIPGCCCLHRGSKRK